MVGNRTISLKELAGAKLATRLAMFIAGFGLACWAPLVPFAKSRLGAGEAELGGILLFQGIGSMIGMPAGGALTSRFGSRAVIMTGSIGIAMALPVLAIADHALLLSAALLVLGAALGAIDIAATVHGAEVQAKASKPIMSNLQGFFSVGELLGGGALTLALSFGVPVTITAAAASAIVLACVVLAMPGFLVMSNVPQRVSLFVVPHGTVVLIGVMCLLGFLIEGAMLDWGAILLAESQHVAVHNAGTGYSAFALTAMLARLLGDGAVAKMGNRPTLVGGAIIAAIGIAMAAWTDNSIVSIAGFALAGIGVANIVPVLFTLAATQQAMPSTYAISAICTFGYLGLFLGPPAIGYVAATITLRYSFGLLAALMVLVAALAPLIVR